jgi:hypothetical protein
VFGRSKTATPAVPTTPVADKVGGKNRPTPKRSSAEAANRRPLVPGDRKEAARAERTAARELRLKARQGMAAGDERFLPARDQGPVRRYVRDVVDARRNLGENAILILFGVLILQLALSAFPATAVYGTALLWAVVLVVVVDSLVLRRKLKRGVRERFGDEAAGQRGLVFYGVMRALQLRRTRIPGPGVQRGDAPR